MVLCTEETHLLERVQVVMLEIKDMIQLNQSVVMIIQNLSVIMFLVGPQIDICALTYAPAIESMKTSGQEEEELKDGKIALLKDQVAQNKTELEES